jgi:hypothetical protein
LWMGVKNVALLADGYIEKAGLGAVGGSHPVGGAGGAGTDADAVFGGSGGV